MSVFCIPVILALCVKAILLSVAKENPSENSFLFFMVVSYVLLNISELGLFLMLRDNLHNTFLVRLYCVSLLPVLIYTLLYALQLSGRQTQKAHRFGLVFIAAYSTFLLLTDLVVADQTFYQYALVAVKGPFYASFLGLIGLSLFLVLLTLAASVNSHTNTKVGEARYFALCLLATLCVYSACAFFISLKLEMNTVFLFPLFSTLFLVLILYPDSKYNPFSTKKQSQTSSKNSVIDDVNDILVNYFESDIDFKTASNNIEKLLIEFKAAQNNGVVDKMAEDMKVPRSSLYYMIKKHNLDHGVG